MRKITAEEFFRIMDEPGARTANDGTWVGACTTTHIYCRPLCPGTKHVRQSNTAVFSSPAEAEAAGFRPCLSCCPEEMPSPSIESGFSPKAVDWANTVAAIIADFPQIPSIKDNTETAQTFGASNAKPAANAPIKSSAAVGLPINALVRTACLRLDMTINQAQDLTLEQFGCTPTQYCATARRLAAKRLMRTSVLALEEVAAMCGFANAEELAAEFSREYNLDAYKLAAQRPHRPSLLRDTSL